MAAIDAALDCKAAATVPASTTSTASAAPTPMAPTSLSRYYNAFVTAGAAYEGAAERRAMANEDISSASITATSAISRQGAAILALRAWETRRNTNLAEIMEAQGELETAITVAIAATKAREVTAQRLRALASAGITLERTLDDLKDRADAARSTRLTATNQLAMTQARSENVGWVSTHHVQQLLRTCRTHVMTLTARMDTITADIEAMLARATPHNVETLRDQVQHHLDEIHRMRPSLPTRPDHSYILRAVHTVVQMTTERVAALLNNDTVSDAAWTALRDRHDGLGAALRQDPPFTDLCNLDPEFKAQIQMILGAAATPVSGLERMSTEGDKLCSELDELATTCDVMAIRRVMYGTVLSGSTGPIPASGMHVDGTATSIVPASADTTSADTASTKSPTDTVSMKSPTDTAYAAPTSPGSAPQTYVSGSATSASSSSSSSLDAAAASRIPGSTVGGTAHIDTDPGIKVHGVHTAPIDTAAPISPSKNAPSTIDNVPTDEGPTGTDPTLNIGLAMGSTLEAAAASAADAANEAALVHENNVRAAQSAKEKERTREETATRAQELAGLPDDENELHQMVVTQLKLIGTADPRPELQHDYPTKDRLDGWATMYRLIRTQTFEANVRAGNRSSQSPSSSTLTSTTIAGASSEAAPHPATLPESTKKPPLTQEQKAEFMISDAVLARQVSEEGSMGDEPEEEAADAEAEDGDVEVTGAMAGGIGRRLIPRKSGTGRGTTVASPVGKAGGAARTTTTTKTAREKHKQLKLQQEVTAENTKKEKNRLRKNAQAQVRRDAAKAKTKSNKHRGKAEVTEEEGEASDAEEDGEDEVSATEDDID